MAVHGDMQVAQIGTAVGEALATASQVEKLSIIGVIALWAGLATWAAWKLNRKLIVVYRQRDRYRATMLLYRAACDAKGIAVDVREVEESYKDDIEEEGRA